MAVSVSMIASQLYICLKLKKADKKVYELVSFHYLLLYFFNAVFK
jgi:hypothetical protein